MATSENAVLDLPDELEDLEICVKEGRAARCVRRYQIRIDRELFTVHVTYMTGQQLLELAGKCDLSRWKIFQKLHGEMKEIGLNEQVLFTTPGIEKFKTIACDQTDGSIENAS